MATTPQSSSPRVAKLPENTAGRDFCVGDLHGMYELLDKLLKSVNFNPANDRLISVGDLVDRGPASHKALLYLNQSWFYAIRGNHEQMLIDHFEDPDDRSKWMLWSQNGGSWWSDQPKGTRRAIYRRLKRLPLALEVDTPRGAVGIVHADIPPQMDWQGFCQALEAQDEEVTMHALWSRSRVRQARIAGPVPGITEVYCGHTIVEAPVAAANVHFIDTGAYLGSRGRLTLVDIQQGPDYRYSLSVAL